jgi:sulfide:quinone oxidoreductase
MSTMPSKTVLILGGGVGGLVVAHRLRRALPPNHRVILIERERHHLFQPSLLWLAVGDRRPEQIQPPLDRMMRKGIELVTATVEAFDPARRVVTGGGQEYAGDAMIVALGAELAPETIPGLAEGGHNLYTLSGATAIRDALQSFRGGRVAILTAAPAYKCPAAPYEAAMLVEGWLRRRGHRKSTDIDFFAAEPGPMGVAGPAVSTAVRQMVESHGIRYHPEHQVVGVEPGAKTLAFANGTIAAYDLLIYIPPHRAPAVVRRSGLAPEGGWIGVDRATFETTVPRVYAIGDVTTVPLAMGKPLPKAGVFAHRQAEVVAANLAAQWTGSGVRRAFDGHGECFLETGDGRAGFGAGNFYAEPLPQVTLKGPNRFWHWGKVAFEWKWLRGWF